MNSSRLPGKALVDIAGKPNLWHLNDRLSHSKLVDKIVVSTSSEKSCDPIYDFCNKENIDCFRGSEEDLLDRLYQTAKKYNADTVVRVTGDCPLVDPTIVDKVIEFYNTNEYDFVANNHISSYPHGLDVEVFSFKSLEKAWNQVSDKKLRALAVFCLYHNNKDNKIGNVKCDKNLSNIRITLDYNEDLKLIRAIFNKLYPKKKMFLLENIVKLLKENPDMNSINDNRKSHHRLKDCEEFL